MKKVKYVCNIDNLKFINTEKDLLVDNSFIWDASISLEAKGVYYTIAAADEKFQGMTIDDLSKYSSDKNNRDINKGLDELIKLNLIKAV